MSLSVKKKIPEQMEEDAEFILHRLEEMNPEARYSLWGSMSNVQEELLPRKNEGGISR